MTTVADSAPIHSTETDPHDEVCHACEHPWADHTAIDVRFCTATVRMSRDRGCVCRPVGTRT
ncbi:MULTISPECIES: RGCVC family protein [unclassified Pseudonocardia]|jgi:hypothetical protein|uniref:RGCVC family protein n=1 Tax=unclassified Pseudonocardia TaxID=2619320 RepID=UPI00310102CE